MSLKIWLLFFLHLSVKLFLIVFIRFIVIKQTFLSMFLFYVPLITSKKVEHLIISMNDKKSPVIDEIKVSNLKYDAAKIRKTIAEIINGIIRTGLFPESLKESIVRLVHKGGSSVRSITSGLFQFYLVSTKFWNVILRIS